MNSEEMLTFKDDFREFCSRQPCPECEYGEEICCREAFMYHWEKEKNK